MLFVLFALISLGSSLPRLRDPFDVPATFHTKRASVPSSPTDPFFSSLPAVEDTGRLFHMDIDGAATKPAKKSEKIPLQKQKLPFFDEDRPIPDVMHAQKNLEFLKPQPGVPPKFTGAFVVPEQERTPSPADFEYFNFGEGDGAVVNPAATYISGGDFEKVPPLKCKMLGCTGPLPNDGTFSIDPPSARGKACHQTFVPLNGCTSNKGYPMGMLCSICCDCSTSFIREMRKTRGYKIGYQA